MKINLTFKSGACVTLEVPDGDWDVLMAGFAASKEQKSGYTSTVNPEFALDFREVVLMENLK